MRQYKSKRAPFMVIVHPNIVIILDNVRSGHNVGSILRTADGAGVSQVYCCGITPYPHIPGDSRAEHVIASNTKEIRKTALGAEETASIKYYNSSLEAIAELKADAYPIYALENKCDDVQDLFSFTPANKFALILGSETDGISPEVLKACNSVLEIPMRGHKNSLNVSVAAGISLYRLLS